MAKRVSSTAVATPTAGSDDLGDQVVVRRVIAASPDVLWSMVSDIARMGEWSPEAIGGRWLDDEPTGPAVGARFEGTSQMGERRWSRVCTVVVADPGRAFGFDVAVGPFTVAQWQYQFEAVDEGCVATETWTDRRGWLVRGYSKLRGIPSRAAHNRKTMIVTLDRLAAAAEAATRG